MPTKTEDDLRELFAPLAADEPSATECARCASGSQAVARARRGERSPAWRH